MFSFEHTKPFHSNKKPKHGAFTRNCIKLQHSAPSTNLQIIRFPSAFLVMLLKNMHFISIQEKTSQIRTKCAYVNDFTFMIHSKENSQLAQCLCGIYELLAKKGEQWTTSVCNPLQKTFNADYIYKALSHQFLTKLCLGQQHQTV